MTSISLLGMPNSQAPSSSKRSPAGHDRSSSEAQMFPVEIVQQILENVPRSSLTSVARTSTSFNEISERLIYRNLELRTVSQATQCFESLRKKPQAAQSVREFVIFIRDSRSCVAKLGPILAAVLRLLTQLSHLHLAIDGPYLPALDGCIFPRLTTFSSVADLSSGASILNEFLIHHPSITSLCLGGDSPSNNPTAQNVSPIALPPTALPALSSYMGSRRLAPSLVPGRPVRRITLAWHSPNVDYEVSCILPSLAQASVPVQSLSLGTPGWSSVLVRAVATTLPALQSLRLHNVSADYHNEAEVLTTITNNLASLRDLTRLELPCHRVVQSILDAEAESRAASQWASIAPRLQTIVFPSSRAWQRNQKGAWESL